MLAQGIGKISLGFSFLVRKTEETAKGTNRKRLSAKEKTATCQIGDPIGSLWIPHDVRAHAATKMTIIQNGSGFSFRIRSRYIRIACTAKRTTYTIGLRRIMAPAPSSGPLSIVPSGRYSTGECWIFHHEIKAIATRSPTGMRGGSVSRKKVRMLWASTLLVTSCFGALSWINFAVDEYR